MAKETNMPGGGTAYYGHSTDSDADFRTAMNLLQGDSHINWTYTTAGGVLKYDWMETGKWIASLANSSYSGFAYSVYRSTNGDVFAVMRMQNNGFTAPVFAGEDGTVWFGTTLGGESDPTDRLTILKLKVTDVLGTGESSTYLSIGHSSSNYNVFVYPDALSASSSANLGANSAHPNTGYRFTILGPITSKQSPSVATFARMIYTTDNNVTPGAYTIAGYNFRIVSNGLRSTDEYVKFIALRNDATTS